MILFKEVYVFVERLFGEEMHEKRVESLSNATLRVMATGTNSPLQRVRGLGQGAAYL